MPSIAEAKERDNAGVQLVNDAIEDAHGAWVDGRMENVIFKHKQLYALFSSLQANRDELLSAISSSSSGTAAPDRLEQELGYSLGIIISLLAKFPKDLGLVALEAATLSSVTGLGATRQHGAGVVVIVGNTNHPIASLIVTLAQAIFDGNPTVLIIPTSLSPYYSVLKQHVGNKLDRTAVHLVCRNPVLLSNLSNPYIAGVISQSSPSIQILSAPRSIVLSHAANPVIVDQSILPYGTIWETLASIDTPQPVIDVARHLSSVIKPSAKQYESSFAPTYILAHENVADVLVRTLRSLLPSTFQPEVQPLDALADLLYATTPGSLDYLPVFKVSTLDLALDTVTGELDRDGQGRPAVSYVFGAREFGAYAANTLVSKEVYVNEVPAKALAIGPYGHPEDFSISSPRHIHIQRRTTNSKWAAVPRYKSLKAKPYVQSPGHRIDFFGGSFLFAAGTFASCVLGVAGYGLVKLGTVAWAAYRR